MANVKVYNMQGAAVGEMTLSDDVFGVEAHVPAMHAVVRAYMNAQRQGTQSALTRTEVRGGGRKIYRQKGTGNARHHGRRAPQFTHGGVVFAPKPRDYRISVPKKVRRLAMKSALSCKVSDAELVVVDKIELAEAKTKNVVSMLKALGADKKALICLLYTSSPERGGQALDLLMIAKYFERIGDHATNIAEWVEFAITGTHNEEGEA